jgi:hypothetical protein
MALFPPLVLSDVGWYLHYIRWIGSYLKGSHTERKIKREGASHLINIIPRHLKVRVKVHPATNNFLFSPPYTNRDFLKA